MKKLIILTAVLYSTANAWEPRNAPSWEQRELIAAKLVKRMSKHKHYDWVRLGLLTFPPTTVHTCPKGQEKVIRNRSDHYFAHEKVKPSWSNGKGKVIGNHTFERHK